MYKILTINGKDYHLEYTIEASLYADCVSKLTELFVKLAAGQDADGMKKVISGLSNIPQTALTVFYAGLIEAHGTHINGDGSVPDIEEAKALLASYMREHKDDDNGNFYGILEMCVTQMGEDGFFKLIGLESITEQAQIKPNRTTRRAITKQSKSNS